MPVRRLKPFRVVITGVENSGKTTLSAQLAQSLGWPWIQEAARLDPAVVENRVQLGDLQRLLETFRNTAPPADQVLFDTGPIVLNLWAKTRHGRALDGVEEAMADIDLFLFCRTLSHWEPDPLRSLPRMEDRLALEQHYHDALVNSGRPWANLPAVPLNERLVLAKAAIKSHIEP